MQVKRGDSLVPLWLMLMFLVSACTPLYRCELLNNTSSVVVAVSAGELITIKPNQAKVIYITSSQISLALKGNTLVYTVNVRQVPNTHLKSRVGGYLIRCALMEDGQIYLRPKKASDASAILPNQPPPFPLKGNLLE